MSTSVSVGYVDNYSYFIGWDFTIVLMYNKAIKAIKQNCFQHLHYLRLARGLQTSTQGTIRMA